MKEAHDILLALLRSALWKQPYDGPAPIGDWNAVLRLAEQQTVLGLVADAIMHLPENFRPDSALKFKLIPKVAFVQRSHALLNRKIVEIKCLLEAHHISCVLLKGQGVALNYPNPLSRQCGDIDLYVGNQQFLRVMNLLEPSVVHDAGKYAHLKHFNVVSEDIEIEVHRIAEILPGIRADRMFQQWTTEQLQGNELRKVIIEGTEVNLPPVDFDVLYIMNHAWHHFMVGGVGLRQLCDWSLYLHRFHDVIDAKALKENLHRFGLTRAWQIFASVAVKRLGLPKNECLLYTGEYDGKVSKVFDVIWSEGNFGMHSSYRVKPRPKGHFSSKFYSFKLHTSRIFRIVGISPKDVLKSWTYGSINGIRNLFIKR